MAALWILFFSSIITYVAHTTDATPLKIVEVPSGSIHYSSAADHCFDDLQVSCNKVLRPHKSLPGLKNPTSSRWYHCECTNKLNKCIIDVLGPYTLGRTNPAYDEYGWVTGYVCYRETAESPHVAVYEKVTAPLNDPDIPIYW